jgi:aspartate aminotransferase
MALPKLSQRVDRVAPSITMAVTSKAKLLKQQGVDVVSFGAGEPDFDTPDFLKELAKTALDEGKTKYTPPTGMPGLREAIVTKFERDNGLTFSPEQICIGPGGKGVLYFAMLALLDDGDEVLIPSPYWVSYPEQAKLCGGVPMIVRGDPARDFKLTPEQLDEAVTPKTKLFIFNSPSNPAGNCYDPAELQALADVLAKHEHVTILSDEIYEKLLYDGQKTGSLAALNPAIADRTITFNCHSKSFAMTGWRLGYCGGPAHVIKAMNKLQGQINSHVTSFAQPSAIAALNDDRAAEAVESMRVEFEKRGRHMHERLVAMPNVQCLRPRGAFYCFPDVSAHFARLFVDDAVGFASKLLDDKHVAVVPGNDSGFDTHVRLSFATSMEQIDKGLDRLGEFLAD